MLEKIRNVQMDRLDLDEAVELLTFGNMVLATYTDNGLESPEWLKDGLTTIEREVKSRRKDNLERSLRELKIRRQAMRTLEEKRASTDEEIARIEAAIKTAG